MGNHQLTSGPWMSRGSEFATPDWGQSPLRIRCRFVMTFPNETLPKGRLQKTTALYDRLVSKGALMDQGFGLEHALWFANGPEDAHEEPSFQRNRSYDYVAREVKAVQRRLAASKLPTSPSMNSKATGQAISIKPWLGSFRTRALTLTPMLTEAGRLYGDLTVACLSEDHFMLFGSAPCRRLIAGGLNRI